MGIIDLKYGDASVKLALNGSGFEVLGGRFEEPGLTDVEIGERLDSPIASERLEDIVSPGEKVLFVVPDATRSIGAGQIVNLLVRRLIANGTAPHEMSVLIATGIHRGVTDDEKKEILTPFIVQRLKVFEHRARDLMTAAGLESDKFTDYGDIRGGIAVRLNRMLAEFDRVITVGGVAFHYFAGFTGGRKLICPGLAAEETISETHKLAFDFELRTRRDGVGPGLLKENAVHEAFLEAAGRRPPDFSVNTIMNDRGQVSRVFCGNWIESHEAACSEYGRTHTVEISERRDLVVASCGGSPHDINLIQAHKTLDNAARACREGGVIVLLAECRDGLGRDDFLDWFTASDSKALAERLCGDYRVNGQTAWSLLTKTETFDVRLVSSLPSTASSKMRFTGFGSLEEALSDLDLAKPGYILPNGSKFLIEKK